MKSRISAERESPSSDPNIEILVALGDARITEDLRKKIFPFLPKARLFSVESQEELSSALQTRFARALFINPDWAAGGLALPLGPRHPPVVVVAKHDQAALAAFRLGAIDYLLSPVDPELLRESLSRAGLLALAAGRQHPLRRRDDRLPVQVGKTVHPTLVREILLFTSLGNGCIAHTAQRSGSVSRPLSTLEAQLDPVIFFRANRSQIFNIQQVSACESLSDGRLCVVIPSMPETLISRRRAKIFRSLSGWI